MQTFKIGDKVAVRKMSRKEFTDCDVGMPKAGFFHRLPELSGSTVTVLGFSESNIVCKSDLYGESYWFSPNWLVAKPAFKGNLK